MSNIGPDKPLVYGDPSYEQGPRAADTMKAPKFPVPLTPTYAHDVKAMVKAHPSPGAYYIVNPNNPTGTMTPREDILWLLKNKPAGSVVIVDEAYHPLLGPRVGDLTRWRSTRTSSLCGPSRRSTAWPVSAPVLLLPVLTCWQKFDTVARTEPQPGEHLHHELCRRTRQPAGQGPGSAAPQDQHGRPRGDAGVPEKHGYKTVPGSQANMFMVDVKRPGT